VSVVDFDTYTEELAVLGEWEPTNIFGRDVAERVREGTVVGGVRVLPANMVVSQGIQILGQVWATLPGSVRAQMQGALADVGVMIAEAAGTSAEALPIIGAMVKVAITNAMQIAEASKTVTDHKKAKSNYAHGKAQQSTILRAFVTDNNPGRGIYPGGLYTRADVFEFAQYVKVRWGGDYDRKPGFARPGGKRDEIFLGTASPAGKGCKKEMRRTGSESLGPFDPKCGRMIGLSASLWPWWSAAYAPAPLTRWIVPPEATFQEPPSPDNNEHLSAIQVGLITDPARNLRASLLDVVVKSSRFESWWDANSTWVHPIDNRDNILQLTGVPKKIDARKESGHSLSKDATSYWYYDESGYIRAYNSQQGDVELRDWGILLPDGDPANLGVTLEQHNAVLSQRAAFAQRRLATLREPALVEAVVVDSGGLQNVDPGARDAIEYARKAPDALLPYPGGMSPQRKFVVRKLIKKQVLAAPPPVEPPTPTEPEVPTWMLVTGGAVLVVGGGAAVVAMRRKS
jgi:hypothetical protein